jgi:hypothetical protein
MKLLLLFLFIKFYTIGAYIKMKDAAWAPAVESYLGSRTLCSFCVDNTQDAKLLTSIMKEIFYNERIPQIISSKFYHQVRKSFIILCLIYIA